MPRPAVDDPRPGVKGMLLPQAAVDILHGYFRAVSRFPNKQARIDLAEQIKRLGPRCGHYTHRVVTHYFANLRRAKVKAEAQAEPSGAVQAVSSSQSVHRDPAEDSPITTLASTASTDKESEDNDSLAGRFSPLVPISTVPQELIVRVRSALLEAVPTTRNASGSAPTTFVDFEGWLRQHNEKSFRVVEAWRSIRA